jgi:hypothetical protein
VIQTGEGREPLASRAFVSLADTLVDDYDVIDLLDRLVSHSVELLAAQAAGIMLGDAWHEFAGGGVVKRGRTVDGAATAAEQRGPMYGLLP